MFCIAKAQGANKRLLPSEPPPELYNHIRATKFRIKGVAGSFNTKYYSNVLQSYGSQIVIFLLMCFVEEVISEVLHT